MTLLMMRLFCLIRLYVNFMRLQSNLCATCYACGLFIVFSPLRRVGTFSIGISNFQFDAFLCVIVQL